jgi:heptosyltransferase-3
VLLAVPALRALAAAGGPLTLAAQPRIGGLLLALGVVDRALAFDSLHLDKLFQHEEIGLEATEPLSAFLRPPATQAGPGAPATIVCWFGARDPGFVVRLTALEPRTIVAPPYAAGRPVWEHLLGTIGVPAAEADRFREPILVAPPLVEGGRRALAAAGWDGVTPLVVVHPGAGGVAKRWPAEAFAAALERVAARGRVAFALHEGPADREAVAALVAGLRVPALRLVEPELTVLAGMLRVAVAFLGNDSGVSHLAATLGVPSVVLFRGDKLDWRPWAPDATPLVVATPASDAGDVERVAAALHGLVV